MDPRTTVPELFAIVRQWVPQVQHKIDVIGNEVSWWEGAGPAGTRVTPEPVSLTRLSVPQILKRGCHVNDRDGLTDMTLLHYSCKAGAHGVGKTSPRRRPPQVAGWLTLALAPQVTPPPRCASARS